MEKYSVILLPPYNYIFINRGRDGSMFCSTCGNDLSKSEGDFCSKCGSARVVESGNVQADVPDDANPILLSQFNATYLIIGILLTIGGIIGIISVISYGNQPFHTFQFGGGSGRNHCQSCQVNTMVLIASIPAIILGVVMGIMGIVKKRTAGNNSNNMKTAVQVSSKKSLTSLILGIIGIFLGFVGVVTGFVGVFLAMSARKDGDESRIRIAGLICSIISIALGSIHIMGIITSIF